MSINILFKVSLIFLVLSTIGFYLPIPDNTIKALLVFNLLLCILLSYNKNKCLNLSKQNKFGKSLFLLFVFIICNSIVSAYILWDQSIYAGLISTSPFLLYGLYLILCRSCISKSFIHNLLIVISIISLLLFYFKIIYPSIPIGNITDDYSRGTRISVPGIIFCWYLYFFYFNKLINKEISIKAVVIVILCLGCFILQKGRSQLAIILLLSLIFYIRHYVGRYKYGFLIVFSGLIIISQTSYINKLVNMTSFQMESSNPEQHVREIGYYYYIFEFPIRGINYLIGNGIPSYGRSSYGNSAKDFAEETKIHLVDIGIVGIYNYWGIFGVVLYVMIFYNFIFLTKSKSYLYVKYFLAVLAGQSILSAVPLYLAPICAISLGCYLTSNDRI